MAVFDAVWIWYTATVAALALLFVDAQSVDGAAAFAGIHLLLLAGTLLLRRLTARRPPWIGRWARGGFALLAMPVIFSSIGLLLPAIPPEPFEWDWLAADRALFGSDPTIALQGLLVPAVTELLQLVYAAFYLIPIVIVLASAWRRDGRGFDRALVTITFCFMFSYLGYFLWPTLPPFHFLEHAPLQGLWLTPSLHAWIDGAEMNHWDCFPSGHTMLSVVSLVLAWRHARALFWPLLPIVLLLVLSTVALRYHYVCDVLAGDRRRARRLAVGCAAGDVRGNGSTGRWPGCLTRCTRRSGAATERDVDDERLEILQRHRSKRFDEGRVLGRGQFVVFDDAGAQDLEAVALEQRHVLERSHAIAVMDDGCFARHAQERQRRVDQTLVAAMVREVDAVHRQAARPGDAGQLGEGAIEIFDVFQERIRVHEVDRVVVDRQRGDRGLVEPQSAGVDAADIAACQRRQVEAGDVLQPLGRRRCQIADQAVRVEEHARDEANQIIVAHAATNQAPDQEHLEPMLDRVIENTGHAPERLSADAGYWSEQNARHCEARGVDASIPPDRKPKDPDADAGDSPRARMRQKIASEDGRSIYAKRKAIVEPVFGIIKQARGLRAFLRRGLSNIRMEWALMCTAHNLMKLLAARARDQRGRAT